MAIRFVQQIRVTQLVPISLLQHKDLMLPGWRAGYPLLEIARLVSLDTTRTTRDWITQQPGHTEIMSVYVRE